MPRCVRSLAFLAVCGLALLCTACGSNNKGKIEGKWKFVDFANVDAKAKSEFEMMTKMGLYVYLEFQADGTIVMGVGGDNQQMLELVKANAPGQQITWKAKYKLQSGDKVEIYDVKDQMLRDAFKGDKARSSITINGDDMTIKDPDGGIGKLVRVKDTPAGGKK